MSARAGGRAARAAVVAVLVVAVLVPGAFVPAHSRGAMAGWTEAAWSRPEVGRAALGAGVVNPPRALTCDRTGATQPVLFMGWTAPVAGGLPGVRYAWSLASGGSGDLRGSGTVPLTGPLRVDLPPRSVGAPGSGVFRVWVVGPSGWTSDSIGFQIQYAGDANGPWTARCVGRV